MRDGIDTVLDKPMKDHTLYATSPAQPGDLWQISGVKE